MTRENTADPEQDEIRARLDAFRKAKDAKQRAVQSAQTRQDLKYPAPFLVPKPEPVPPKPLSTHGFYDPEKKRKPAVTRPWRSTTTVSTGTSKNPSLTKRSPPTVPTLKAQETRPPVKRRPQPVVAEPNREGTTCVGRKSAVVEQTKRNGVQNRPRERTGCTGAFASKPNVTIPAFVGQRENERKVSNVRRDFRSTKSWKLRVINPKTGFTVSEEHVPATYLYMLTLKDALNAAKRNDRDLARAIFEILYTEERRTLTINRCRPIPVERPSYWMAWAQFEEEEGNYQKALSLVEEAVRRQKEPDELLLNMLIKYVHRNEQSGKRAPLQPILLTGSVTASESSTLHSRERPMVPIGRSTASENSTLHSRERPMVPIGSSTASESSTLHSRSATPSPEPRPFEVLEDPDSPMPSVPDFQSSIAQELAGWSPTKVKTEIKPEKMSLSSTNVNSTTKQREQSDGLVDSDESFMEIPVLGTPQSRLGSDFTFLESESSRIIPHVSRNEKENDEDRSRTTDITDILNKLDINDRRDEKPAKSNKKNVRRSIRFATDSEDSTVTVLTPVRPTKKEKDQFGINSVITPVRRSARHLPTDTIVFDEDDRVAQLLEENGYSYVPNKSLKPTTRVSGTPRFQSKTSAKENVEDADATPNARKIAMQRRFVGTKKSQDGTSDSEQKCSAVSEETGLLYKYGEVTPSKRVKSLLGCDVTLSAVRRSARNLNRIGTDASLVSGGNQRFGNTLTPIVVDNLEDLPTDIEYGYLPNPNIIKREK